MIQHSCYAIKINIEILNSLLSKHGTTLTQQLRLKVLSIWFQQLVEVRNRKAKDRSRLVFSLTTVAHDTQLDDFLRINWLNFNNILFGGIWGTTFGLVVKISARKLEFHIWRLGQVAALHSMSRWHIKRLDWLLSWKAQVEFLIIGFGLDQFPTFQEFCEKEPVDRSSASVFLLLKIK